MGKRDTRVAFVNPVAAARSSGPAQGGPSIKDYLSRPRPSWDELKEQIKATRKGSRTLEQFEKERNMDYRAELDRGREKFFNSEKKRSSSSSSSTRSSSTSSTNSSINNRRHKKSKKKKKKHHNKSK
uniref:Uncharacterized protein n=1 Tax=Clytia hemisphaerica TaxID=252671 RepID=A0A7M5WJV5_9CNID